MALPFASTERVLRHQRLIDVRVYSCGNGRWEVDAYLKDTKAQAVQLQAGLRPAGEALHDMLLRLIVDEKFNVLEAGSQTLASPYPGYCEHHGDAYKRLVGLNLLKGFRHAVRERLGGVLACTHLTELAQTLPTAVLQGFAGEAFETPAQASERQPFQFDRCHALSVRGEAVRQFYPRWYRSNESALSQPLASASPSTHSLETEQESLR